MKRLTIYKPKSSTHIFLGMLPFVLLLMVYMGGSSARLAENPNDKLLPSFSTMGDAIHRVAMEPSKRTGEYVLWSDTASSLKRLGFGLSIAALIGLVLGIMTGALPVFGSALTPLITVISLVPPLALLPILFIVVGLGEVSKVALITIGIAPMIARDISRRAQEIPDQQLVKALTLGANSMQIILRVYLPQLLPHLFNSIRLAMGAAWLFLIAAEAIASTDGLGYRIFLVRRYLSMDLILPYVAWITLLAFIIDWLLIKLNQKLFPWFEGVGKS